MLAFETAIGTCGVEWSESGITRVLLAGPRVHGAALEPPPPVRAAIAGMVALLAGERRGLTRVVLDERGIDPFRRAVFAATRAIGPGSTASYGEIARAIGAPGAARAVGAALGSNPFPIVVPCHRVVAAGGANGGFSAPGGVDTKLRLLAIEGATLF
jgi:methylated-DNA-[protein]-cysteine S-methyltransferase